jgi:hypothetical protein
MSLVLERFHCRLKDTLRARCAAANWVYHLPWVLLGLRAAARKDDGTTPTQAVFGTPLILPGQFLDSPELPSKDFLEQFSKTLSAAEHPSTRHNTANARRRSCPTTCPRTNGVHEVGRPCTAASTALRWPLRHPSPLPAPFHAAHQRQGEQGVHPPAQTLHRPHCAACAAQGRGPPACRRPLAGFAPARVCGSRQGTHRTAATRTAPGTVFLWPTARGFFTPRRRSRPCHCSAHPQPPSASRLDL